MTNQHSYIACVRQTTRNLPDIDEVVPINASDDECLREINQVLVKHGATSRFGVNLLHSHFDMAEDEVLLEETDIATRRQILSVVKKSDVPAGAIYMDHHFDTDDGRKVRSIVKSMDTYENPLLIKKIRSVLALSEEEAIVLFNDVKQFIALCATNGPRLLSPPRIVDRAWHEFILITKDYSAFCDTFCGRYIHHQPSDPYVEGKDYAGQRELTRDLAGAAFGVLSKNWEEPVGLSGCTHNCGGGSCDGE